MTRIILIFLLAFTLGCEKQAPASSLSANIDYLLESGQIDTFLHLRLSMYEEFAEKNKFRNYNKKSIYSKIDALAGFVPNKGKLDSIDIRTKEYKLLVHKDYSVKDSTFLKVNYENRTNLKTEKMRIEIEFYNLMGYRPGRYSWPCEGDNCLNFKKLKIDHTTLAPKLISIDSLYKKAKYLNPDNHFKYSTFSLKVLEIEYSDSTKLKHDLSY